MEIRYFLLAVVAVISILNESVAIQPQKENTTSVKLESKDLEVVQSNLTGSNDTLSYRFQCIVNGLSEEELEKLTEEEEPDDNVVISVYGANSSNETEEQRPYNIQLKAVNGSLIITGEIRSNRSEDLLDEGESLPISRCDVIFQDAAEGREIQEPLIPVTSGSPPRIVSDYNHAVLMYGAPEQVLSCVAEGFPKPELRWSKQGRNETPTSLSRDNDNSTGERTSYLLFSQVNDSTAGQYECTAENEYGKSSKIFEVEVISVEAINLSCNDLESRESGENNKLIYSQNIYELLRRSKRHLWYQWRGQKVYVPPFNRPLDPMTSNDDVNSDMQKMVNFITERLNLADKVAVNKWDNNLPVEDAPREQIILENMVRQAENRGLDPTWAQRFFRDQIEANKDIQYELIRIWRLQGRRPPGPPVDLRNDVRPQIDLINGKLIELGKRTELERRSWKCRTEVEKNARYATFLYSLDPLHQKALQRATQSICVVTRPDSYPLFPSPHQTSPF